MQVAIGHPEDPSELARGVVVDRSSGGLCLEMATPLKMAYHLASASNSLAGIWLQQHKLEAAEAMLASARAQAGTLGARELVCENYRLKADSPALKLGFVPIDFRRMGPRREDK